VPFIHGARSIVSRKRNELDAQDDWLYDLSCRKSTNVVVVALANKLARIAWAVLTKGEKYKFTPSKKAIA